MRFFCMYECDVRLKFNILNISFRICIISNLLKLFDGNGVVTISELCLEKKRNCMYVFKS